MRLKIFSGILLVPASMLGQPHAATPVDNVVLEGLAVEIPGAGWHRVEGTPQQVVLERTADGQRTTVSFSSEPMEPLPEDQAFLRFAEDRKGEELSKLERVSLHYNWTHVKGVPCLVYDGIFQDSAVRTSPFLSFRGQHCRHPDSAGRMVKVELVQRSDTKEAAYKIDLSGLAEQVFDAVQFIDPAKE